MHLYVARGMRGGISIVSKHYVKVNNQLVEGYKPVTQEFLQRSSINAINIFSHSLIVITASDIIRGHLRNRTTKAEGKRNLAAGGHTPTLANAALVCSVHI